MDLRVAVFLALAVVVKAQTSNYVRFCYYTNWSQYRPGDSQFWPEDIDPFLCTHVFFAFAVINEDNHISSFEWNDEDLYARVNSLKDQNPDLKTVLGVGGWGFGMNQTSIMLATPESRAEFINSVIPFLRTHGFDGLDLDFEYPGNEDQGSQPIDKYKFTALVMEMKAAFEQEVSDTGNPQLLLTAAVAARKINIDEGYQIEIIAQYLDYILLMSYDFYGPWSNYTGIHSALYPRDEEEGNQRYDNVDFAVDYWIENGAIAEHLVLGIPMYGRSFILATNDTGLGAPVDGPGPPGPYTREAGFYSYYEICSGGFGNKVYNEEHMAPYGWRDDIWIGYEDDRSLACKINYMKESGLAGFFIWAIDLDDFNGNFCGEGVYPSLNHLVNTTEGDAWGACFPSLNPTTTTPAAQSTTAVDDFCNDKEDGLYSHPDDCTKFINCIGNEEFVTQCPECLVFDPSFGVCDYPCEDDVCYSEPCDVTC